ncbi:MAG: Asp-tRNA(Asn)/Glu-tRNA(Gln) amidotransferase subunit GatC [Saprospiraceae bacterium]|nr:Asp-tRNA(Asn)/Glu-tRNA(Gln) amidotransferase subunit GatC [Saprospiraceae bacterium]
MTVDDALILKLEKLAKLELSAEERERLKIDLEKVLGMFSVIGEADTTDVEPLVYLSNAVNSLRSDIPGKAIELHELSEQVPLLLKHMFAVPKVIE